MSRRRSLTALVAGTLLGVSGTAQANADVVAHTTQSNPALVAAPGASASTSAAIKRRFGVFRRKKTRRDNFPARTKKKRAEAAAIDSRLVYSEAKFSVYLFVREGKVCIARVNRAAAGVTCAPLRDYLMAVPPALISLQPIPMATIPSDVSIPTVDGVASIERVSADGTRTRLTVRNNIVVDKPNGEAHYEWKQPSGITATVMKRG